MRMCEYANNFVDMAFMIKLIKEEKIYIWHVTTGIGYSPLLNFDEKISLPFYYQDWHRNFYLVIDYYDRDLYIYRKIPEKEIKLIFR